MDFMGQSPKGSIDLKANTTEKPNYKVTNVVYHALYPSTVIDLKASTTEKVNYELPNVVYHNSELLTVIVTITTISILMILIALFVILQRRSFKYEEDTVANVRLVGETQRAGLEHIRILLIGPTGSGKSSTGNTILNKPCFNDGLFSSGVTRQCTKESVVRFQRKIEVVDTPGFSNFDETTWKTVRKLMDKPDAVLLVLHLSRFTYGIQRILENFTRHLGENIFKVMFIIFTMEDELHRHGKSIEDFVKTFPLEMQKLKEKCNNRIKCINNVKNGSENTAFVQQLVEEIEDLSEHNKSVGPNRVILLSEYKYKTI